MEDPQLLPPRLAMQLTHPFSHLHKTAFAAIAHVEFPKSCRHLLATHQKSFNFMYSFHKEAHQNKKFCNVLPLFYHVLNSTCYSFFCQSRVSDMLFFFGCVSFAQQGAKNLPFPCQVSLLRQLRSTDYWLVVDYTDEQKIFVEDGGSGLMYRMIDELFPGYQLNNRFTQDLIPSCVPTRVSSPGQDSTWNGTSNVLSFTTVSISCAIHLNFWRFSALVSCDFVTFSWISCKKSQ